MRKIGMWAMSNIQAFIVRKWNKQNSIKSK